MQGVRTGGVGGVTSGRSMRTCMPSPGPMWATWLKLVGLDIILERSSGSLSISLRHTQTGCWLSHSGWQLGGGCCRSKLTKLLRFVTSSAVVAPPQEP